MIIFNSFSSINNYTNNYNKKLIITDKTIENLYNQKLKALDSFIYSIEVGE